MPVGLALQRHQRLMELRRIYPGLSGQRGHGGIARAFAKDRQFMDHQFQIGIGFQQGTDLGMDLRQNRNCNPKTRPARSCLAGCPSRGARVVKDGILDLGDLAALRSCAATGMWNCRQITAVARAATRRRMTGFLSGFPIKTGGATTVKRKDMTIPWVMRARRSGRAPRCAVISRSARADSRPYRADSGNSRPARIAALRTKGAQPRNRRGRPRPSRGSGGKPPCPRSRKARCSITCVSANGIEPPGVKVTTVICMSWRMSVGSMNRVVAQLSAGIGIGSGQCRGRW